MITINTNLASLLAQRNLKTSTLGLNKAIERMTTGFKINHAGDNAANYSISTNLTTRLNAYQVAQDNTSMGLDMLTTAMESLDVVSEQLTRVRQLAEQASNDTYGEESLAAINSETQARISEANRLMNTTEYNGIKLLENKITFMQEVGHEETLSLDKLSEIEESTTISSGRYCISSAEDLEKLARMTNAGKVSGGEFVLSNDIDLSSISNWTAIGTMDNKFSGILNGNGYTINNLHISTEEENQGLFGVTNNAEIKNLGMYDVNISANGYAGALVGHTYGDIKVTNSFVDGNISSTGKLTGGLLGYTDYDSEVTMNYACADINMDVNVGTGPACAGGLIGSSRDNITLNHCYTIGQINSDRSNNGGIIGQAGSADKETRINNCFSEVNLTSLNTGNGGIIGGIIGKLYMENCYATGNVHSDSHSAGGLIGALNSSTATEVYITNCFSTGNISADSKDSGGLIGRLGSTATAKISNSYATGNVSAGENASGGLVGGVESDSQCEISNSYATGNVFALDNVGGLIGSVHSRAVCAITNSYASGSISAGEGDVGGIVGWQNPNSQLTLTDCSVLCKSITAPLRSGIFVGGCYQNSELTVTDCSTTAMLTSSGLDVYNKYNATDSVTANIGPIGTVSSVPFTYDNTLGVDLSEMQKFKTNNISFQVGIYGDENSSMSIDTGLQLKLRFDLSTADSARNALTKIDEYLAVINQKQTEYGAMFNRLESALDSIGVSIDNLTSTRSTLRDADVAQESSAYIRNQILQQAAATLLATANQTPSIALQLI